jgi:hypothetical protein
VLHGSPLQLILLKIPITQCFALVWDGVPCWGLGGRGGVIVVQDGWSWWGICGCGTASRARQQGCRLESGSVFEEVGGAGLRGALWLSGSS